MSYSDAVITEKLNKLSGSAQSIQTLSHWIMYHRSRCKQSVEIWDRELRKTTKDRKLLYVYLANDILQTSRKKGTEFLDEFAKVLPSAFAHVASETDNKVVQALQRLLDIWTERTVYSPALIQELKEELLPKGKNQQPLQLALAELEEAESQDSGAFDNITSTQFSSDLLNKIGDQAELAELSKVVSNTKDILDAFKNKIKVENERRTKLVSLLNDCIAEQSNVLASNAAKLQTLEKQLEEIESFKKEMAALEDQLPPTTLVKLEDVDISTIPAVPSAKGKRTYVHGVIAHYSSTQPEQYTPTLVSTNRNYQSTPVTATTAPAQPSPQYLPTLANNTPGYDQNQHNQEYQPYSAPYNPYNSTPSVDYNNVFTDPQPNVYPSNVPPQHINSASPVKQKVEEEYQPVSHKKAKLDNESTTSFGIVIPASNIQEVEMDDDNEPSPLSATIPVSVSVPNPSVAPTSESLTSAAPTSAENHSNLLIATDLAIPGLQTSK